MFTGNGESKFIICAFLGVLRNRRWVVANQVWKGNAEQGKVSWLHLLKKLRKYCIKAILLLSQDHSVWPLLPFKIQAIKASGGIPASAPHGDKAQTSTHRQVSSPRGRTRPRQGLLVEWQRSAAIRCSAQKWKQLIAVTSKKKKRILKARGSI